MCQAFLIAFDRQQPALIKLKQSSTGEDEAISLWWEPAFWLARCRKWLLICLQGFPALAGAYTLRDLHIHLHIEIPPI